MNATAPLFEAAGSGNMRTRIFIVEDNLLMRRSRVEALERESDLTVCGQVAAAREALAAIALSQPDEVVTDLELRSSNGVDLINTLRALSPRI